MFDKINTKSTDLNNSIKENVGVLGGNATSLLGDGLSDFTGLQPVLEPSWFYIVYVFFVSSFSPNMYIFFD